jgi:enoyl-CoA hydratase/carnithine racemase
MDLKVVRLEVDDGVAVVTLCRPDRLNAWTGRMHHEYRWAVQAADEDPAVRAIVVTGEGRGFCAGADSTALAGHAERGGYDPGMPEDVPNPGHGVDERFEADFAWHLGLATPTIAAVNGPAAGVGLVLACYCDLRVAAAGAKLTSAHGRLNLPAEYGLSWLLPRIVGVGRALDLLLSSRVILAEEALEWGLVNRVVPAARVRAEAVGWARELATTVAPHSLTATRRQVWLDQHRDVGTAVREAAGLLDAMMGEPDYAEGVSALVEKRPPRFAGPGGRP